MIHPTILVRVIYNCVTGENRNAWLPKETLIDDVVQELARLNRPCTKEELEPYFEFSLKAAFHQFIHGPLAKITTPISPPTHISTRVVNHGI